MYDKDLSVKRKRILFNIEISESCQTEKDNNRTVTTFEMLF